MSVLGAPRRVPAHLAGNKAGLQSAAFDPPWPEVCNTGAVVRNHALTKLDPGRLVAVPWLRSRFEVTCLPPVPPVTTCPSLHPALLVAAEHPVYHSINARVPSVPPRRVPLRARDVPTNSYQFRPWLLRAGQPAGRWPRPGRSQRGSRCVFRRAVQVLAREGAAAAERKRLTPAQAWP